MLLFTLFPSFPFVSLLFPYVFNGRFSRRSRRFTQTKDRLGKWIC